VADLRATSPLGDRGRAFLRGHGVFDGRIDGSSRRIRKTSYNRGAVRDSHIPIVAAAAAAAREEK
jgi:hypothetical protein